MCIGSLWDVMQLKKPNSTKLNKLNQITQKYLYKKNIYILLTRISNITFNPQLVLFDRLPNISYIFNINIILYV